MHTLDHLFANNRAWSARMRERDPDFFTRLAQLQSPEYLWIGCADSRVPATEICGLLPGEMLVHRNVANVVVHSDMNCLSVIQFAVDVVQVKHIIVTGHYGCSGVMAAFSSTKIGLGDNWLRHVKNVHQHHHRITDAVAPETRVDVLCELNVIEQVVNVCQTTVLEDAWARGQNVTVHGWVYGLQDGLTHDLNMSVQRPQDLAERYQQCTDELRQRHGVAAK